MFDLRALKIYVDGACPGNTGGAGGFAAWIEFPFDWGLPDEFLASRGYFRTTNNRMELRACLFAHEWVLDERDELEVQLVQIATDSKYVHDSYQYSLQWSQKNWRNAHDRTVANIDLWKSLTRIRKKIAGRPRVELVKIGRCSSTIAKNVDRDAKLAANSPLYEDDGYKPGKIGRARNNTGKAGQMYPAAGQDVIIHVYGTRSSDRGVQMVKFQTYCGERRDFVDKFWAYADDSTGNSLHRGNAFRVRMNDLPQNPRIVEIVERLDKSGLIKRPVPLPDAAG